MADAPATERKAKLPSGYKDEDEFIKEARERFQHGVDFDRLNRDEALEDLRFLAGEQWDLDAKARRKGRPMLTINRLPQFVAQVVGDIRINQPAIKVRATSDDEVDLAEVREGLIRQIERASDASGIYTNCGQNQTACGIGNFRISLKYATDDGFDRDIIIQAIPNAFSVVWDPMATERTGKDAQYCFVQDMMPRKAYELKYGTTLSSGLEVPLQDVNGWYTQDLVRVTEYWVMKSEPVELALLENGDVLEAKAVPKGAKVKRTRKSQRKTACVYLINGNEILDGPVELPIDRVPIIRAQGWEVNVGDRRIRWGLVRFARDPQRLQNYWRSISAEMLALAPKGKWLIHEVEEGDADEFRGAVKSDDPVLSWSGNQPPQYIGPPTLNAAVLQESALSAQDMKDVTGLHDASLGAQSNETSGKAIMARERQGDTATYIYIDNLHAAIEAGGDIINQLIPKVYDTARTIRVIGKDETAKVMRINDPANPDSLDINQGKFDVAVEAGPSYSTRRVEASESMMQFVQAVPAAAQVAGDLIAKAQDWPLAEEIGDRLKATLPPQVLAGTDQDKLSPQEQQQLAQQARAAQQQQQMQDQAHQLALAEQQAKVQKTQAEAAKTAAEAKNIGVPTENPQYTAMMNDAKLRQANAMAAEAEANAGIAYFNLSQMTDPRIAEANASKAESEALSAHFEATAKPLDVAHRAMDLNMKMNPPEASEPPEGNQPEASESPATEAAQAQG